MRQTFLDHITVTAPTLEAGAAYVAEHLGVSMQSGGQHPRMGTHNQLLRLGDTVFLEVIAVDPGVAPPQRPRWFDLDRQGACSRPRLSTWVVRSENIDADSRAATEALGAIEPMQRGSLTWLITIPADGSVPGDGVAPAILQWQTPSHPALHLQDKQLTLARLEIHHPEPARIERLLDSIQLIAPVQVLPVPEGALPGLVAHINTPHGIRVLSGLN